MDIFKLPLKDSMFFILYFLLIPHFRKIAEQMQNPHINNILYTLSITAGIRSTVIQTHRKKYYMHISTVY